jgi:tetratricopeptide (TPR) repeat protein
MAAGLLAALSVTDARALDTITVAGEVKAVAGEIVAVSKTEITIKAGLKKEERKVAANAVLEIRFDKQPAGLKLARDAEAAGRYTFALEKYTAALADDPSQFLKPELEFLIARTTARMAMADTTKLAEAVKLLSGFLSSNANSFRYYPALAQLGDIYLAQSNFAEAQTTFTKLEQAPWTDYKMAAGTAQARLLLKQNNVAGARAAFEKVTAMQANSEAEKTRRYDALLGKAICLQREGQHEQAVKDLAEISSQAPAGETRLLAEAYVRQGDSYRQIEGRTKDAILAYLHVDVLFEKEAALHAESLYWLSKLWNVVGHPDRAAAADDKLQSTYQNSKWASKPNAG